MGNSTKKIYISNKYLIIRLIFEELYFAYISLDQIISTHPDLIKKTPE
uniref:Uncharacterized protein n=1 Tax=uncultured Desulfobacterium sp. TaxID=201089 RepID=E1YLJ6_9BACT|nr:unknown protein [uncultured Desulfobacterium sp.]